ncbi:MAG: ABC transporter permease [Lachnospiraceae bacterium]|nr:ABC transporter permease [Lachnospiraceae bacterium]
MNQRSKNFLKVAVISVLASLLLGAVVILILGKNPFLAYYNLLQGCGLAPKTKYGGGQSQLTDFSSYVDYWTPMIFAALSCAFAMKAGLFNIGISGQMLTAGFIATITVGYAENIPGPLAKILVVLIGAAAGMGVGALIGFLKYKFNINEVVSSIMLNYIARYIISFFIQMYFIDPVSRQSRNITDAARLTFHQTEIGGYKYDLPIGFILALIATFVVKFVMDKTVYGYDIKAVGLNRTAARYAGIRVGRGIVSSMAISGLLAGIAGVTYYLGYFASIQPKVLISTGFDAIAVCLLGNSEPVGILVASFLIEIISKGSAYMSSQAGLESEIASVVTGLILLASACNAYFLGRMERRQDRKLTPKAAVAANTGKEAEK